MNPLSMNPLSMLEYDSVDYTAIFKEEQLYDPHAYDFVTFVAKCAFIHFGERFTTENFLDIFFDEAAEAFGCMTYVVFNAWSMCTCTDVGRILHLLVTYECLPEMPGIEWEQFADGFDFKEAFWDDYTKLD